jgi:hypothetical protein
MGALTAAAASASRPLEAAPRTGRQYLKPDLAEVSRRSSRGLMVVDLAPFDDSHEIDMLSLWRHGTRFPEFGDEGAVVRHQVCHSSDVVAVVVRRY